MSLTQSQIRSEHLTRLFQALSDRTRLRLLNVIAGREICVCYLGESLRLPQPKISQHLARLRRAGLVAARRDGKWMHYRLVTSDDPAVRRIIDVTLEAMSSDRELKADRGRLIRACGRR